MAFVNNFSRSNYTPLLPLNMDDHRPFIEDQMGMKITTGSVVIKKDDNNLIGISIGGGAPYCPCLYIVQVFDNSPTAKDGTLQSGDELIGINGCAIKGKTKIEVAKMIQASEKEVNISYNKLHADPQQGKTLDIILKKVKHRLVEHMSTETADALGLSRAILCSDTLIQKLKDLENIENTYRGLVQHATKVMKAFYALLNTYKAFGDCFAIIGVRDPNPHASKVFGQFGDYHRKMERLGIQTIKSIKPVLADLETYLSKAIPDTKLTIRKYADAKFEYLSYCLKVKEMDDEEYAYASLQEILYRVDTGNYEYRLILRCRQQARARFAQLRSDVMVKLELLDNKHVQDVVWQLQRFVSSLANYHSEIENLLKGNKLFPIEVDLPKNVLQCSEIDGQDDDVSDDTDEETKLMAKKLVDDDEFLNHHPIDLNAFEKNAKSFESFEIAEDVTHSDTSSSAQTNCNSDSLIREFEGININGNHSINGKSLDSDLLNEAFDCSECLRDNIAPPPPSAANGSNSAQMNGSSEVAKDEQDLLLPV